MSFRFSFSKSLQPFLLESANYSLPRHFHSAPSLLARRSRERNRPKPPIHPSVPSFKLSPDEPTRTTTSRRKLLGFKTRSNSDEFGWKLDSSANVLRRRDGITGKYEHSKVDWVAEKRRKFFKIKEEEHVQREDERFVARRSKDSTVTDSIKSDDDAPPPPSKGWSLPSREWNRGAPTLVHEYGRESNPIYSYPQRQALALLRKSAFAHEKRRQELLSQPASASEDPSQDASFWDYEKNFRNPLYDFFRGGSTMEDSSVTDSTYHFWSVAQLRRKSFQDLQVLWYVLLKERNLLLVQRTEAKRTFGKLVDPANPGEPLSTIKNQLKRSSDLVCRPSFFCLQVQFSMRNIKVTVSERRRAIQDRIDFLAKFQAKRGRSPTSQQWHMAIELEKQRIRTTEGHQLQNENLDEYFASPKGREELEKVLTKRGLKAREILENMTAFDLGHSQKTPSLTDCEDQAPITTN
ncbi:hypothetical protein DFH28DRAFT_1021762, partial [Melampsora americana]